MTTAATSPPVVAPRGRLRSSTTGAIKICVAILLCLTPVTALIVLGWLTRKTSRDVAARRIGQRSATWPNLFVADGDTPGNFVLRICGALLANLRAGAMALTGTLAVTLPFSLVWLLAWLAGWENSFNKGYELAGLWPLLSLAAVFMSLPVMVLLPMAVAHQAVTNQFRAILEFQTIARLVRHAGWRYLVVTLVIGIGSIGVLGARALPTFAEQITPAAFESGDPEAFAKFADHFRLVTSALLVVGLIVVRRAMAWCYAVAITNSETGRRSNAISFGCVLTTCATVWLGLIFLVYVAQFLNFAPWNWINQPILMLPWLG